MSFPKVDIVIVNWRGWQHTVECLESLKKCTYPAFRTIVVDNGSGEEDLVQLRKWKEKVELIEIERNQGFASGSNIGIRYACNNPATEYVLILNNDTIVAPDFLTEMIEVAQSKKADMVSPTVLAHSDGKTVDRLGIVISKALLAYNMKSWGGKEPFCPSGCCALYGRQLLEDTKLAGEYYDEDFFAYAEDVDLGIRAVLLGYSSALAPKALVYHKGSAATFPDSPFALYHRHRNTIWYLAKSIPSSVLLRHGFWILLGQIVGVFTNIFRRRGLLILKAKLAGLCGVPKMLRKRRVIRKGRDVDSEALENALDSRPFYLAIVK